MRSSEILRERQVAGPLLHEAKLRDAIGQAAGHAVRGVKEFYFLGFVKVAPQMAKDLLQNLTPCTVVHRLFHELPFVVLAERRNPDHAGVSGLARKKGLPIGVKMHDPR